MEHHAPISQLIPALAYDPDAQLFFLDPGALGFGYLCSPMTGGDDRVADRLNNLLNLAWPSETILQFCLWAGPDISPERVKLPVGPDVPEIMRQSRETRVDFLRQRALAPLDGSGLRLRHVQLIVTVRLPLAYGEPTDSDQKRAIDLRDAGLESLKAAGLADARIMTVEDYLRVMETIFNWSADAAWRQVEAAEFDPRRLVRDQIVDYNTDLVVHRDRLELGGKVVKVLSPKRLPESSYFGVSHQFLMDPVAGARGIKENVLISAAVYIPDTEAKRGKLEKERQWVANQAYGPLIKYVPRLAKKKQSYDVLFEALDRGDRLVRIALAVVLFCEPGEESAATANAQAFWRESGFQLLEDRFITLPMFLNSLPLGAEPEAVSQLNRYRTMGSRQALLFLPVFGSWQGTATPVLQFVGRDGQLMFFDLFDSSSNYNAVIAAQSGSGKSFLTNEIIMQYLSLGGRCWVLDIGRSYEKLTKLLGETFMVFDPNSDICLNPFSLVENYNEEADVLAGLVAMMAAPTEALSDFQTAGLKRVLNQVWEAEGKEMSLDSLALALKSEEDGRLRDIGEQLYPFTTKGEYGRFFNGPNNVNIDGRLIVIELEELRGRKQLQQVVLLQLIYQIQQEMYLGQRDRRKLVIIDEAWDLLTQGNVAQFIEHGFRRFRKYGGAAIVVTQSVNDLYNSPSGEAIAENSAIKLLLGQTREAIARLEQSKRIDLGDYGYSLLKTVHTMPGKYSEIAVLCEGSLGVGRLYVEDFKKVLYSTKADDVYAVQQWQEQGLSLLEAVERVAAGQKPGRLAAVGG